MSGGVDSAVAAARAVDAGHDVTGVHLALCRNPRSYRTGARGCCTIEDAGDARRAADVLGHPVLRLGHERASSPTTSSTTSSAEYAAGRTPNPCLRCNEKIKFAAVLDRALALGFDAVATGHYAQLARPTTAPSSCTGRSTTGKDQSYVLGVLTQRAAGALAVPARRHRQGRRARRGRTARPPVAAEARQPRHLLHLRRRHRGLAARPARRRPATSSTSPARCSAARGRLRLHRRPAPRAAPRRPGRRRQAAVRARHRAGERHGHRRPARAPPASTASSRSAAVVWRPRRPAGSSAAYSCGPTATSTARRRRTVDGRRVGVGAARAGQRHRARSGPA